MLNLEIRTILNNYGYLTILVDPILMNKMFLLS